MTNTERIATLRANIAAKQGTTPTASGQPVDILAVAGRLIDIAEQAVVEAKPRALSAWERFQVARLERKAERLGC